MTCMLLWIKSSLSRKTFYCCLPLMSWVKEDAVSFRDNTIVFNTVWRTLRAYKCPKGQKGCSFRNKRQSFEEKTMASYIQLRGKSKSHKARRKEVQENIRLTRHIPLSDPATGTIDIYVALQQKLSLVQLFWRTSLQCSAGIRYRSRSSLPEKQLYLFVQRKR